jgi:hypothetical protein
MEEKITVGIISLIVGIILLLIGWLSSWLYRAYIKPRNEERKYRKEEPQWKGVELEGCYYTWDGPPRLEQLEEKPAEGIPQRLPDMLEKEGLKLRECTERTIPERKAQGYKIVYNTDKRNWKKKVQKSDTILMVKLEK